MNDPKTYVLHLLDGYFVEDANMLDNKNFKTVVAKADYDALLQHISDNLMSRGLHDSRMHAAEEREKTLQEKLNLAVEALKFYGNEKTYLPFDQGHKHNGGKLARETLEKLGVK